MSNPSNPNGANGSLADPRQIFCWEYYIDPKSETFGNAKASAIRAKYEPEYASQITTAEWFIVKLRRLNMLGKAERNLDKALDIPIDDEKIGDRCLKVSTFIAERLGKNEGYAARTEHTGKDGNAIEVNTEKEVEITKALTDV